jgi:regulatory protein
MRALSTRERTVAELRACLENKRVDPADIDAAVEELAAAGLLDDARYARRFAEDKRELQRWGSERIERDLRKRGIAPELIETVLGSTERSTELESAVTLLRARFGPPRDDRERDRAWRLLVRRGYEAELAYEAVRELSRSALA